jgi:hypothetical protein
MDSDPFLLAPAFDPDAVHRLDVDSDGDARPDIAFSFVFSALDDGAQTATARYATGGQARQPEAVGNVLVAGAPVGFDDTAQPVHARGCRFFFGVRSDPFFADGEAPFHGYQWTGVDTFAGKNILTIAVEGRARRSARTRRSACGERSACARTASGCRWTAAATPR